METRRCTWFRSCTIAPCCAEASGFADLALMGTGLPPLMRWGVGTGPPLEGEECLFICCGCLCLVVQIPVLVLDIVKGVKHCCY